MTDRPSEQINAATAALRAAEMEAAKKGPPTDEELARWDYQSPAGPRQPVPRLIAEVRRLRSEVDQLGRILNRTRFVAEEWRVGILSGDIVGFQAFASHPLCMVLAALDGETDPAELGLTPEAHDAFRGL